MNTAHCAQHACHPPQGALPCGGEAKRPRPSRQNKHVRVQKTPLGLHMAGLPHAAGSMAMGQNNGSASTAAHCAKQKGTGQQGIETSRTEQRVVPFLIAAADNSSHCCAIIYAGYTVKWSDTIQCQCPVQAAAGRAAAQGLMAPARTDGQPALSSSARRPRTPSFHVTLSVAGRQWQGNPRCLL